MFDIPYIHNPNMEESNLVANALVDCEDKNLFRSQVVQSIITFRWQLTRKYVLQKLFMPYLVYFLTYIIYVTAVFDPSFENTFDKNETGMNDWVHLAITILLCLLSVYFLVNELRSFRKEGFFRYWTQFWNYVDIIPPIMIMVIVGLDYYPEKNVQNDKGVFYDANEDRIRYLQYSL